MPAGRKERKPDAVPPANGRRGGALKRALDASLAAVLLLVLSPLFALCAVAVLVADGRPVLFRHVRVGQGGRQFALVKFRTMRPATGSAITSADDPRVTPVGRVLRRLKLDELPQLWNVLVGDMALVGPRPEVPAYVARLERAYRAVLDLRPGVTDWASLVFRDEERVLAAHAGRPDFYESVLLPRKLALARLYRRRRSTLLDLRLVLATACVALGVDPAMRLVMGRSLWRRARRGLEPGPLSAA